MAVQKTGRSFDKERYKLVKQRILALLFCLLFLMTGCSSGQAGDAATVLRTFEGMEAEAVIDYTVPKSLPGILVNQAGYGVETNKTVIFTGEELPETFRVYNAETKQMVYEGKVIKKENVQEEGRKAAYGSFQEVDTPGNYYIEADILGYSYPFPIGEKAYWELLCGSIQHLREGLQGKAALEAEEILTNCQAMVNLLLACELHGAVFDDEMGISESGNHIPDLIDVLLMQAKLLAEQGETVLASEDRKLVSYYAAALAKFSYTYKEYDSAFATSCLQLSDMAWKHMEQIGKETDKDMRFMAATELYRASGGRKYLSYIREYGASEEFALDSREAVYGAVTYISTKQPVDIDLCSRLMKVIMEQAEEISACSKDSGYQVCFGEDTKNEDILWNMVILIVVDKVISNHEYAAVIENHLHFFLGSNPLAVSYVEDVGTRSFSEEEGLQSVMDKGFQESIFLFMLSQINDKAE